jgi:hypothetical protein
MAKNIIPTESDVASDCLRREMATLTPFDRPMFARLWKFRQPGRYGRLNSQLRGLQEIAIIDLSRELGVKYAVSRRERVREEKEFDMKTTPATQQAPPVNAGEDFTRLMEEAAKKPGVAELFRVYESWQVFDQVSRISGQFTGSQYVVSASSFSTPLNTPVG